MVEAAIKIGQAIQDVNQLRDRFNQYLREAELPSDTVDAVRERFSKMSAGKQNLWIARRLDSMGVKIEEGLFKSLQNQHKEPVVDDKERRRRENLASAPIEERRKNKNRVNASKIRFKHNMGT